MSGPMFVLAAAVVAVIGAAVFLIVRRTRAARAQQTQRIYDFWDLLQESTTRRMAPQAADEYLKFVSTLFRKGRLSRDAEPSVQAYLQRLNAGAGGRKHTGAIKSSLFYAAMFFIPRTIRAPWFDQPA